MRQAVAPIATVSSLAGCAAFFGALTRHSLGYSLTFGASLGLGFAAWMLLVFIVVKAVQD